eukprot:11728122-Alexandrium_andersonii.AAC.1
MASGKLVRRTRRLAGWDSTMTLWSKGPTTLVHAWAPTPMPSQRPKRIVARGTWPGGCGSGWVGAKSGAPVQPCVPLRSKAAR